ncbi:MAG: ribosome hibernation-promoting factor, HPF/YfiA family [Bacteroidota bacterium]
MDVHITARRFKAHKEIRDYALESIQRLDKFYDGILRSDVILSYERTMNSVKTAEVNVHIQGNTLNAKEKSEDFILSLDRAIDKLIKQLDKVKTKTRVRKRKLQNINERFEE